MQIPRHLDITDEDEAGTMCGDLPEPLGPCEETLTTDPAGVTCGPCRAAYAVARIEYLVFGREPEREGVRAIMAAEDWRRLAR